MLIDALCGKDKESNRIIDLSICFRSNYKASSMACLDKISDELEENPQLKIFRGHTDAIGGEDGFNIDLFL